VKYVLDTNAVSALMRGDPAVIARLERAPRSAVSLPGPVLAEITHGIERLPRSKRKDRLRERYESIRAEMRREPWSDEVSASFGVIKATLEKRGQPIEDFDAAIAAHALASGAVLVTANLVQMIRVPGLLIEDWTRA
jgi:tRNA(fMet)-specific endonuclease VapC